MSFAYAPERGAARSWVRVALAESGPFDRLKSTVPARLAPSLSKAQLRVPPLEHGLRAPRPPSSSSRLLHTLCRGSVSPRI